MSTSSIEPQASESMIIENQQKLIKLLEEQNQLLLKLGSNITDAMEQDEEGYYHFSKVRDFDMSMKKMVGFSFKWFIATIPLGIVIGVLYWFLSAIFLF